jgi:hypothetical protein
MSTAKTPPMQNRPTAAKSFYALSEKRTVAEARSTAFIDQSRQDSPAGSVLQTARLAS